MERTSRGDGAFENGVFEPFDLTLTVGPGLVPWISAASRLGHVHGIPRRRDVRPLDELLDAVYDFVDAVHFAERDPKPFLTRELGQLVFGEPSVLELFHATRGAASDRGREVLVRILAAPHLSVLPWELLPDPAQRQSKREEENRFLALAPDVSLVRLARGRTYPVRTERLEPPLNLLVVLSSPTSRDAADDSLAFDIYEEKRSLLAELRPLVDAGLLCVDVEDRPTLENLRRRIGSQRLGYHLVHYLGHALPDRLVLEDEQARREDQSANRFTEILQLCPDLRLAVFAGCETARAAGDPMTIDAQAAEGQSLLSLSDRCVQDCCPAVVGMQAVLPFRTERLFTRFFYQGIVSGYSVAGAIRLARGATRGDRHVGGDLLDWAVPVLFVGGSEPGPIVDPGARGVPPKRPARHVLRLGLTQEETRFFSRDVALRQAIDILAGEAPERVLVLKGPAGVGKTMLIDRALEEVTGEVAILYVDFNEIAPVFASQLQRMREHDWNPGMGMLDDLDPQAPLEKLCELVAELMARGGDSKVRDPKWTPREWWLRIMDDLTSRRFVLVIDNLEQLAAMEEALTDVFLWFWFARRFEEFRAGGEAKAASLPDVLDKMIDYLRNNDGLTPRPGGPVNALVGQLRELTEWLGGYGRKTRDRVTAAAERVRGDLRRGEPVEAVARRLGERTSDPKHLDALRKGFERLTLTRKALDGALCMVANRRSGVRLAVSAAELPEDFLNLSSDQRFVLRLGRLTCGETLRWVRRNLPGLLRYGEERLERLWPRMGPDLKRWEDLEQRVLGWTPGEPNVEEILNLIVPGQGMNLRPGSGLPGGAPRGGSSGQGGLGSAPRGQRPLRLAVAGPFVAGAEAIARAVTRLAADHGVGGQVVTGQGYYSGSLAVLLDEPSPFNDDGSASDEAIHKWLQTVAKHEADIVLLDYGRSVPLPIKDLDGPDRRALKVLPADCLMIAAGGNRSAGDETVTIPAAYPEVLAVGSLNGQGALQSYAEWTPQIGKPDLFMKDQLLGTPLQEALTANAIQPPDSPYGHGTHGASFAAMHAVAAAVLAWSTVPDLTPARLKQLLRDAAQPIPHASQPYPMKLEIADAVAAARRELVRRELDTDPCSLQTVSALTGLSLRVANDTLEAMMQGRQPEVRRLTRGRLERFELIKGL